MNDTTIVAEPATILVVDDAPINIGVVVESLENRGFRVLVALDGEEALERAHFSQPDLILLDVKMPGIDGFETCRRLKRDEQTREIPVIFMTSLADTDDLVEGFSAGGIDYVTKPFQVAEMLARIRTHLALRAMHKQLRSQNDSLSSEVAVRQQAQEALSRVRDELEIRVAERTDQLARANANLHVEIDERKRTETKLVSSEARFRTIVETSPVPLCITSMLDGRVLYMNGPFRWLFGFGADDCTATYMGDFYNDPTERDRTVELLRAEGGFTNAEIQFRNAKGERFWAVATARIATFADAPAIYVGLNDVTARKQAEEKLRASEASLANAQRLAKLGDWEWNAAAGVTHWSYEMYRILGLEPTGVRPSYRTLRAAIHPEDRAAVRQAVRAVITDRQPHFLDCRLTGADGEPRIVQLHVEASHEGPGYPLKLVGTIQDMTERKRVEQELLESRERLRELSAYMEAVREEERKRIAMEIHDELGQLLTALKMDVSLLRMRLNSDSEAARKTEDMRELVEKTIWMVRNVASHLRPAALNFGILSALEWLVDDFVRRNRMPCQLSIHGSEPVLPDAHATAVFRIAQASLTNVARHADASRVDVTLTGDNSELALHISDNGCGFDLPAARRRYSYGLLGMSERARLIGGTLQIESAPGAGTVVSIHVPLRTGKST
ncbi:Sensor histidine kinase RcsC [Paraburkholderia domus]|uniref:Sensor histidine kinase RcsC n=1 Tax=Paraburkholderia domus TaxID=2793075 RepID=A0A9N8MLR8_9BURK|nr:response regulator [Paraburkholderia domus]MBK5049200.1 response regulator [Burkholderia sp. R-70006]MBK5060169.1 response regulator [Burkholderia sp. R-70199]MBK5085199.1 response regulator [Burkholderia sp. R-69927]MBK5118433.1 response regulator [Burkholderia sp. R-69980]MBK5164271.1 response regulator [Burkholderia sp. R-70211]MBK5179692.1 response regulator [Burkholderia sp. R-69749]MCI0144520.1 response regulator [Paraburkholderia sediminicola]